MPSPAVGQDHHRALRARLEQLGYAGVHFGSDSAALVQRLLSDLIQTTTTCRQLKAERDRVAAEKADAEKKLPPLRQELAHLTADNNALHLNLIKQIEERDAKEKAVQLMVKRHQNDVTELKFLNSQYLHKIKLEQRKAEQERAKVEDWLRQQGVFAAMSKGKAIANTKAVKTDQLMHKMQRIEMETMLEPMEIAEGRAFPEPDPHVIDIVKLSEARVQTVEQHCHDLEVANADLEAQIQAMHSNISVREEEIARLGEQLEQARSSVVRTSAALRSPAKDVLSGSPSRSPSPLTNGPLQRVEQLESQLAFLQDHAADLEQRAKRSDAEKEELRQEWKTDRDGLLDRLRRAQEKNEALMRDLDVLESLVDEFEKMREDAETEARPVPGTADQRVNVPNPRSVKSPVKTGEKEANGANDIGRAASQIERLRKELSQFLKLIGSQSPAKPGIQVPGKANGTRPFSPGEKVNHSAEDGVSPLRETVEQLQRDKRVLEQSLTELRKSAAQHAGERADFNRQIADLRSQLRAFSVRLELTEREKKDVTDWLAESRRETQAAANERDKLIGVLESFEKQFIGLEDDIRGITAERDNIRQLYEQTLKELRTARQALSRQAESSAGAAVPESAPQSGPSHELSMVNLEVRQLKSEISDTKRRYESLQRDNAKFVTTTEQTLRNVREERDSAQGMVTELTYDLSVAREKINQYEKELEIGKHDAEERKEMTEQMKTLVDRLNRELQLAKEEVTSKTTEIHNLEAKIRAAEAELLDLHQKNIAHCQALDEHKAVVRNMDSDRDQLHAELDAKTEKMLEMGEMVQNLRHQTKELEGELADARNQEDFLNRTINELDREIASLRRQLDELIVDRDATIAENRRYVEENRNLGTDLEAVTSENQILNRELAETVAARDKNLAESAEKAEQIKYLEGVIITKEQEREQLMASYRKLINENERLENGWKTTSDDAKELRMEIVVKENKIQSLQKAVNEQTALLRQYNVDFQAYEKQANQLTRTLAALERELRLSEDSKQKQAREISAARELAASIDRAKEDLQKHVTAAAVEREKLRSAASVLETEKETIMARLKAEVGKTVGVRSPYTVTAGESLRCGRKTKLFTKLHYLQQAKCERLEKIIAFERTEKYRQQVRVKKPVCESLFRRRS